MRFSTFPLVAVTFLAACGTDPGTGQTGGSGNATGGSGATSGGTTTNGGSTTTTGGATTSSGGATGTGGSGVTSGGASTTTGGATGTGGSGVTSGGAGGGAQGGATSTSGGASGGGGKSTSGGKSGSGGSKSSSGGTTGTSGGATAQGGTINVAGGFVAGGSGGGGNVAGVDCGAKAAAIENNGPTTNRVNYVIIGDGYTSAELETTYMTHLQAAMTKRFNDPIGQVYLRYRKFVNICAVKLPSTGAICGSSALACCGDDTSRLANCNTSAANSAITSNMPSGFEVDWRAVVLNGSDWWNTGAALMLWSGGNRDAAGAALHEGGHGFHQLADEYGNCGSNWVNNSTNNTAADPKWGIWLGFNQTPGTGMQGYVSCGGSNYRPSQNSMMNSLFGNNADTSFNAVSREKMIMDIWRIIERPWDAVNPPAGAVTNPASINITLIDPAVISVDWSVDGNVVAQNGGPNYAIGQAGLAPGAHTVVARMYDNAGDNLVKHRTGGNTFNRQYWGPPTSANMMKGSERTLTWNVTIQ